MILFVCVYIGLVCYAMQPLFWFVSMTLCKILQTTTLNLQRCFSVPFLNFSLAIGLRGWWPRGGCVRPSAWGGEAVVVEYMYMVMVPGAWGSVRTLFQLTDEGVDFFRDRLSFSDGMAVLAAALPSARWFNSQDRRKRYGLLVDTVRRQKHTNIRHK